jgi:SAM-dependent MidA family methyltransferase
MEAIRAAIRAAIAAAGGAIPFSEFQRVALYGPDGFYMRPHGGRAGRRRGDFITSAEVGPLFGVVLARYLDDVWRALGEPSPARSPERSRPPPQRAPT